MRGDGTRPWLVAAGILTLALYALAPACNIFVDGGVPRRGLGACDRDDQCREGRVCVDGACQEPDDGSGPACGVDPDCPSGKECEDGWCRHRR
ncbi:MAG: hypothetical protein L0Y64_20960, partial [Myxococcaceae bacterium]|nr:hypothetical protein [Myxococcaceae bacterium]